MMKFARDLPMQVIPMVVEDSGVWERSYDIYSLLLKQRIIFLDDWIDSEAANLMVAQLLYLNGEGSGQPIHLYISNSGGDMYDTLAIYDAMQLIATPVYTYAVGITASMGTVLLVAGEPHHRYALPHATIHINPASGGAQGYTEDVRIAFREQERLQTQLFHLLGKHSGHGWQAIEEHFARDRWLNTVDAQAYGFIDHILGETRNIVLGVENGEIKLADLHPEIAPLPRRVLLTDN